MKKNITVEITSSIAKVLMNFGIQLDATQIKLEHPANPEFGDLSSNIALTKFKEAKKTSGESFSNPRELATELQKAFSTSEFPADNVAGPGFLNFKIPQNMFLENVQEIIEKNGEVITNTLENTRIITEFTDPNPFKEFHIGHLYSNSVGEAISRLLESTGASVRRVCYQGDVGMHVAKALWGLKQLCPVSHDEIVTQLKGMQTLERIQLLGKAYSIGATAYEDNPTAQEEMKSINKQVFSKDPTIYPLYEAGRTWSLEYFETIYQRLGTKFEDYYFESNVAPKGVEIVQQNLEKGLFEKSEGAIIFPGSKYGLHDRVFINSLGLPTYEAKELGLAPTKYADWKYDKSIIITGNEINEYFKVLLKALSLIEPELAEKTTHLSHGMVRLPEGKMSSRKGNVLTGEWLLNEAKHMIQEIISKNRSEMSVEEKENVAEVVAIAAVKYALLKSNVGGDISFNFEESVSFEGNSGPYIQYSYARCKSVLRKASELQSDKASEQPYGRGMPLPYNLAPEELTVLRLLYQFDEVVQHASGEFSPHYVCTYLFELAQAYNSFYNTVQILKAEDQDQKNFRLQLTKATSLVLQKGLYLLGIKTVEQM